jgi:hypothetical protein
VVHLAVSDRVDPIVTRADEPHGHFPHDMARWILASKACRAR